MPLFIICIGPVMLELSWRELITSLGLMKSCKLSAIIQDRNSTSEPCPDEQLGGHGAGSTNTVKLVASAKLGDFGVLTDVLGWGGLPRVTNQPATPPELASRPASLPAPRVA